MAKSAKRKPINFGSIPKATKKRWAEKILLEGYMLLEMRKRPRKKRR